MLRKLLPFVVMVFVSACANTQNTSSDGMAIMQMACCEKCECCKSKKCGECCKDGKCSCCKDGNCKMCMNGMPSMSDKEECPECAKAEREWQTKHGKMKH